MLQGRPVGWRSIRPVAQEPFPEPILRVAVPPHPQNLRILQLLVSSQATRLDATTDEVDDLSLAVHEAGLLVLSAGTPTRITMEIASPTGTEVEAVISAGGIVAEGAAPVSDAPFAHAIEALTDSFELTSRDGTVSVQLTRRFGSTLGGEESPPT